MKKHTSSLLLFLLLICTSQVLTAQRRDRERDREEAPRDQTSASRLWYGGGFNIGFGAFNGFSSFNIGISPMVGYRIAGPLSAGPRIALDFTSLKQRGIRSVGLTSVDVGAFLRCRVFQGLFVQGEVSNEWFQDLDGFTGEKFNDERVNQRIGAGWNFGQPGGGGTEISVLYNFRVANDLNTWRNPIEYRFGFTWRF
ncbi:MAG: hypothetical protein SFV22_17365 [Saprospiraceae bacterium]|nr:hypothetical protein [Saprospiraceae bacterium]